jgi:DNA polymerase-3 subunit epsilon
MADVDTLIRTFQAASKMGMDVALMIEKAMRPKSKFIALVSYEEKDKAKNAGFAWNAANKAWERSMPEEDTKKLPFKVKKVA